MLLAGQWEAVSKHRSWLCVAEQVLLWPSSSWLAGRNPDLVSCLRHFIHSWLAGTFCIVRAQDSTCRPPASSFLVVLESR